MSALPDCVAYGTPHTTAAEAHLGRLFDWRATRLEETAGYWRSVIGGSLFPDEVYDHLAATVVAQAAAPNKYPNKTHTDNAARAPPRFEPSGPLPPGS